MKRILTALTILIAITANGQWPPERAFPENYPSLRVGDSIDMPFLQSGTDTVVLFVNSTSGKLEGINLSTLRDALGQGYDLTHVLETGSEYYGDKITRLHGVNIPEILRVSDNSRGTMSLGNMNDSVNITSPDFAGNIDFWGYHNGTQELETSRIYGTYRGDGTSRSGGIGVSTYRNGTVRTPFSINEDGISLFSQADLFSYTLDTVSPPRGAAVQILGGVADGGLYVTGLAEFVDGVESNEYKLIDPNGQESFEIINRNVGGGNYDVELNQLSSTDMEINTSGQLSLMPLGRMFLSSNNSFEVNTFYDDGTGTLQIDGPNAPNRLRATEYRGLELRSNTGTLFAPNRNALVFGDLATDAGVRIDAVDDVIINTNFTTDGNVFKYSSNLSSSFTDPNEIPSIGHVRSNISDTADVVRGEFATADNLKLNISDTAVMLSDYTLRKELSDTASNIRTTISGKQDQDALLTALSGLSLNGILVKTSATTAAVRGLSGSSDFVINNEDGVAGDPSIELASSFKNSKLNVSDTAAMLSTYANFSHDITSNNYTLTDADFGELITNSTVNSDTIIIPAGLTGNDFISRIDFENYNAGNIVIEAAATVSLNGVVGNSLTLADQFAGALLRKIGANEYILIGSYE